MLDSPSILKVLEDAQLAHKAGDFLHALKFYEQFFDHALDDDPTALYGVRLSYCLLGWRKLADQFPGAMIRLQDKRDECLQSYHASSEPEQFHDYWAICRELDELDDAVATFAELHQANPASAAKLSKYVWSTLVEREKWHLCNALLLEPSQKLDECFSVFDESNRLAELDPQFDTREFINHTVDSLLGEIQGMISVLRHGDRAQEVEQIQHAFFRAVSSREHAALNKTVNAQGAFLFTTQ